MTTPGDVFIKISEPRKVLGGGVMYPIYFVREDREVEEVDHIYMDSVMALALADAAAATERMHS